VRGYGGTLFLRTSLRLFTPFSSVNRNRNILGKLTSSFQESFVEQTGVFVGFSSVGQLRTKFAPLLYTASQCIFFQIF